MEPKTRKVRSDKGKKRATYKKRATGIKRGPYKKRTTEQQLERRIKISYNNFVREGKKLLDLNLISATEYKQFTNYKFYYRNYKNQMNNPYVAVDGDYMSLQQKKNSRDNIRVNYVIRAGKIKINKDTGKFLTKEDRILVPMHKFFLKTISKDKMFESQRKNYNKLIYASQQLKNYDLTNVDTDSDLYRSITTFKELNDYFEDLATDKTGMYAYNGGIIVKAMIDSGFSREEAIAEAHARGFNS